MTLNEFLEEYDNLTVDRQQRGLSNFLKSMTYCLDEFEYVVKTWAEDVVVYEQDDAFGTEGMDV